MLILSSDKRQLFLVTTAKMFDYLIAISKIVKLFDLVIAARIEKLSNFIIPHLFFFFSLVLFFFLRIIQVKIYGLSFPSTF